MSKTAKLLDQFYTNPKVADQVVKSLLKILPDLNYEEPYVFLEPSAGSGAFLDALENNDQKVFHAYDIDPKDSRIQESNFLKTNLADNLPSKKELIVVGNPPFGKKASLAKEFMNKSFTYSDTVAFILPLQFRKYLTQKTLPSSYKLVVDEDLPEDSFIFRGSPYLVRCSFQVWTTCDTKLKDLRKRTKPPTSHPDFQSWIYNCTPEGLPAFEEDWEFAVRRQGWEGFTPIKREEYEKDPSILSRKIQWMFFKGNSNRITDRLIQIDFEELANLNTSVRGFGKADIVEYYERLYPQDHRTGLFIVD